MERISTFEQLDDLMTKLHDCPFDLKQSSFDKMSGVWSGIFLRPLWDHPRVERHGVSPLYLKTQLPVVEATIKFAGVQNVEVVDDQGIDIYTFNEIERGSNGVRLLSNQAMQIKLDLLAPISATYDEKPLPGLRAIYRQFLLVQSGPEIATVLED